MKITSVIKSAMELGVTPDQTLMETQKTYLYNFYSLFGVPVHLCFAIFNISEGFHVLAVMNLMQITMALLVLYMNHHHKYLGLRLWILMLSTAVVIAGAVIYRNGNEYMLLSYLIGAVIVFDKRWKYFLYALITILSFTYIRFNVQGHISLQMFFESRFMLNVLIALVVLTFNLQLFKLIYVRFSRKLERMAGQEKNSAKLYEFLSKTNDVVIHAATPEEIYTGISKIVMTGCSSPFAVITLVNARDESICPFSFAAQTQGVELEQCFRDHVTNKTAAWASDPLHQVIRDKTTYVCNDLESEGEGRHWSAWMLAFGFRSFIVTPVCEDGEVIAMLHFFATRKDRFGENERNVLNRVAENIGLFVKNYNTEQIRKRTEDQLKRVTQAVEQSMASIVITDLKGNIEYVNPAFTKVTGYSKEEAIGQNPRILKTGHTDPTEYQGLWKKLTSKEGWDGEFLNRKKNGDVYWEKATISPVIGSEGEIINFVAVKEDITERKKLEATQQQLFKIFENAKVFVLTTDLAGNVEYANAEARRVLGIGDIKQQPFHLSALQPPERITEEIAASLKESGKWTGECVFTSTSGTRIPVLKVVVQQQDEFGNPAHISITAIDITKVKESELKLKMLTEELRSLSVHLQDVSEKEKADIARELHDELGQILTVMRIDVELLQQNMNDPVKTKEGLSDLMVSVGYLTEGFRKLLGTINTSLLRDLGIIMAVEALADKFSRSTRIPVTLRTDLKNEQIDFRVTLPVFRLVQESLTNIMRHASATHVSIELAQTENHLKLIVTDNGKGFDVHSVDTRQHHGLLGMRERIYAIEGDIQIESNHGHGTKISAMVPLLN